MVPVLDSNSIVLVEKIFIFESLKVGDIIVYKNNDSSSQYFQKPIIHRITKISDNYVLTKGDNNQNIDPQQVRECDLIGRAFCIIYTEGEIK
jgi:signal peptidase I